MALEHGISLKAALAWTAVAVAVVLAIPVYVIYQFETVLSSSSMCGNKIARVLASPDGNHFAVLFERDCGAMDGFSTQVSVLGRAEKLPDEPGNALTAYAPGGHGPRGDWGGPNLVMRWQGNGTLVLLHDRSAAVQFEEREVQGVKVLIIAGHLPNLSN